jgi:putative endonuclease
MTLTSFTLDLERRVFTFLRTFADRKSTLPPHLLTGERGEDAAFFHLRKLGYTVVARRWRSPRLYGDLDLLAWDGPTLVVFEVKTRTGASSTQVFLPAEAAVDPAKQRMLRRMASAYLHQVPQPYRDAVPVRFDILAVYLPLGGAPAVFQHFPNAFPRFEPQRRRF